MQPPDRKAPAHGAIARMLGAPIRQVPDRARLASPIHQVTSDRPVPPFLIMHGDADDVVPLEQSTRFADTLATAGHTVTCTIIPGSGHGFPCTPEIIEPMMAFFDRHLRRIRRGP